MPNVGHGPARFIRRVPLAQFSPGPEPAVRDRRHLVLRWPGLAGS